MNNNLNGAEKLNKISVSEINKSIEAVATASNAEPKTISQIFKEILIEVDKFNWQPLKDQKQQIDKVYFINKKLFDFFDEINISICEMERGYYAYTGTYWEYLDKKPLDRFLADTLNIICNKGLINGNHKVKRLLFDEFRENKEGMPLYNKRRTVSIINVLNGTLKLQNTSFNLLEHNHEDFCKYVLPYEYNRNAECPKFLNFLNAVLPDKKDQDIIFEYLGWCFMPNKSFKIEKILLLYGTGSNGKSVFYEIVNALFGNYNVSKYPFNTLASGDNNGNNARVIIGDKILNYCSDNDFNKKNIDNVGMLKILASGETIQGKYLFNDMVDIDEYAKLIFNCNHLPKQPNGNDHAFFRRFVIIPFDITIPEAEQNRNLANEIINAPNEMAGILNLVIAGFKRLHNNKGHFTESKRTTEILKAYQKESDSVGLFIDTKGYKPSQACKSRKELFKEYKDFCEEEGHSPVMGKTFKERLEKIGIKQGKEPGGNNNIFYCSLISEPVGEATEADQSNLPF